MVIYTRTWIDRNLTRPQRQALVDWLLERSTNPTGKLILAGLGELLPELLPDDLPSEQACITWRNKVWQTELSLRRIREQRDVAKVLADAGSGKDLDEANRVLLQSMIMESLQALREGRLEDVDPKLLKALGGSIVALTRQRQAEERLEADLAKAQRDQADWEAKQKAAQDALSSKTSDRDKVARMRALFGLGQ